MYGTTKGALILHWLHFRVGPIFETLPQTNELDVDFMLTFPS